MQQREEAGKIERIQPSPKGRHDSVPPRVFGERVEFGRKGAHMTDGGQPLEIQAILGRKPDRRDRPCVAAVHGHFAWRGAQLEQVPKDGEKTLDVKRLGQDRVSQGGIARLQRGSTDVCGKHHDRGATMHALAKRPGEFPARQARHGDVEDEKIRLEVLDDGQAGRAVTRRDDGKAERFEQRANKRLLIGVVVRKEDRSSGAG